MNKKVIIDTMALVLHLEKRKMGEKAKEIFNNADVKPSQIIIPSMVLVEISYLYEKGRIKTSITDVENHLNKHSSFKIVDLNLQIIKKSFEITDIPELHDRLVAGTAFYFNLPLITNDPVISRSQFISCIWK